MRGMAKWMLLVVGLGAVTCTPTPEGKDAGPKEDKAPPPPVLVALSPAVGLDEGGETVTLSGQHLGKVTIVSFGSAAAVIESTADDEIVVTSPPGDRGKVTVSVTGDSGAASLEEAFTYEAGVAISSVTPAVIAAGVATSITIEGSGFFLDDVNPTVRLASTVLTLSEVASSRLTAQVPAQVVGVFAISVENADGRQASVADGLTVRAPATITAVDPDWSFTTDATAVDISGTEFGGVAEVLFGDRAATSFTVVSSTLIHATAPTATAPGAVDVIVRRGPGDEAVLADGFTYYGAADNTLRVLGVEPSIGRTSGGTLVDVYGTGFNSPTVKFAGVQANVEQIFNRTHLRVTTPGHTLGGELVSEVVDVSVEQDFDVVNLPGAFAYYRVPVINQVQPTTLPSIGGAAVSVEGEGFTIGTTQVFFGTVPAQSVTVLDQAHLTCVSPVYAEAENVPVTVQTAFETSAAGALVSFRETTAVASVFPTEISPAGRSYITVVGTGFSVPGLMTVQLDGKPVTDLMRSGQDNHTLTFRSPSFMTTEPGTGDVIVDSGAKELLIRNNETGDETTSSIEVVDFTDVDRVHKGGPIQHNLNITVIDDISEERVHQAVAFAGLEGAIAESTYNKGETNELGLVVLSGDEVVTGPVTLTIGKEGYETQTLIGLDARYTTVRLLPYNIPPEPDEQGTISGSITGWDNTGNPPSSLQHRYYKIAQVFASDRSALEYNLAPGPGSFAIGLHSGQTGCHVAIGDQWVPLTSPTFAIDSKPGTFAALAFIWFWDSVDGTCDAGTQPNQQEGWVGDYPSQVFGLTTNITVTNGVQTDVNINLDLPAVNYGTVIDDSPSLGAGGTAYRAEAHLELGESGVLIFGSGLTDNPTSIPLGTIPSLLVGTPWTYTVWGYVGAWNNDFNGMIAPISLQVHRGQTSMSPVTLSDWVYFPTFNDASFENGTALEPTEGRFRFTRPTSSVTPNITAITVFDQDADTYTRIWSILAAGDVKDLRLPELGAESLPVGRIGNFGAGEHFWELYQIKVDNFDFNNHTYDQRSPLKWRQAVQSSVQTLSKQ